MIHLIGYYDSEEIKKIIINRKDNILLIFHVNEDDKIKDLSIEDENIFFIKVPCLMVKGKIIDHGFLVYETVLKLKLLYFNSNADLVLANIKNSELSINNILILSNIIKNDDGNDLIFFLSNILGMGSKIVGIDYSNIGKNSIYHKSISYESFFIVLESQNMINYLKEDDFWEDYLGPFIISDAFDGGFKNISWQNPVKFFIDNIHSLSFQVIENSIKYFPLKIITLKDDYSIVKLKVDLSKSIEYIYNDISLFSYQYAFIEKCNLNTLFYSFKKLSNSERYNFFTLCGDLFEIIHEVTKNNLNLSKISILKKFTAVPTNLVIIPTKSIPFMTTNCIFAL